MAKFIVLVDKPAIGDKEAQLKDGNGRYVWHLLFKAKAPMHDLAVEFLYDENGHSRWRTIEATHKPTVVLAMGQDATDQFDIEGKVLKTRGSVYEKSRPKRKMYVVPTFHPQDLKKPYNMFAEESLERGFYTAGDIRKAVRVYKEGWPKQVERFNISPTVDDVRSFVDMALEKNLLLGCDLEATGLSIEHAQIVVHGFAWSEHDAIVIPETKLNAEPYWKPNEWAEVYELLSRIYSKGRLMFQNGVGYDIPLLRARGWHVNLEAYTDETMILHHTINPELPHNIGFISSVYGQQSYWKDIMKDFWGEKIYTCNQEDMRLYNARDCVALHQIYNSMTRHMQDLVEEDPIWEKLPEVYQKGMQAARVVIDMQRAGLALDDKKVTEWHKYVEERLNKATEELQGLYTLPELFNLSSGDHLRWLLYGEKPKAWGKKYEDEMGLYNTPAFNLQYTCKVCEHKITKKTYDVPGSREFNARERVLKCPKCKTTRMCIRTEKEPTSVKGKSKESKKYLELLEIEKLMAVEPLYKLKGYVPRKTKKGNDSATDKNALVRYLIALNGRISTIDSMRRRLPAHDIERENLVKTRDYIVALQEYTKIVTLRKSFWDFPTWQDGRVRPSFLVTGTATGRFSCKKPNLQQVPSGKMGKRIRSCFKASKGYQLLSVDFSNLEVQIGSRIFGDDPLNKMLEAGINMHDNNTEIFFGITPDHPDWETLRKVSKIIMFGRLLYGGSDNGIYSQVMTAVPDCGLTLKDFKQAVQNYFDAHPQFLEWMLRVQKIASDEKVSVNAFGRVRSLFGPLQSIKRQALNSPIQGSAADMMRDTMILIDKQFKDKNLESQIILQIHDELVFSVKLSELKVAGEIIRDVMNREVTIGDYTFRIPIDVEKGTFWGRMESIDLVNFESVGGSKH